MNEEEREYQKFMSELMQKGKEVSENYDKLSDDNKRRVQEYFKPIMDTGSFLWLFGNKNKDVL